MSICRLTLALLYFLSLGWATSTYAEDTGPVRDGEVSVELIADHATLTPGSTIMVGFHFRIDNKWHIYWKNPGDTGFPPEFDWRLPAGVTVGDPIWPTPMRYQTSDTIVDLVYEDEVLIQVPLTLSADFSGDQVTLEAFVEWLMCKDVCIPGEGTVRLTLPVGPEPQIDNNRTALFAAANEGLPRPMPDWDFRANRTPTGFTLSFRADAFAEADKPVYFFSNEQVIAPSSPQRLELREDRWVLSLQRSPAFSGPYPVLAGVLTSPNFAPAGLGGRPFGYEIELELDAPEPVAGLFSGGILRFVTLISLAFIGGLILNLMPCVFPILGIKVMGFVQQGGQSRTHVALHGLTFTAGVMISFWILSIILILLRAGGEELGWGFQLQEPAFNFALILILLVFALNLSGVFEFGLGAVGLGSKLTAQSGWSGSFFSGALATVVATPCSAPFLAPALGAALALPALDSLVMFTAIALGLSTPYLLLSIFPQVAAKLPRPGAWMESFKQFMAFPLYATVGFLIWILAGQLDANGFLALILGLTGVCLAVWIYGRWTRPEIRKKSTRRWAIATAFLVLASSLFAAFPREAKEFWQPWSEDRVATLRAQDRWIYVDFTARWCATCQTNKAAVFSSQEIFDTFDRLNMVPLQADWTNRNPDIARVLASYGRSAIPVNILYAPGAEEGIILPELLTPGIVLDYIARAEAAVGQRN